MAQPIAAMDASGVSMSTITRRAKTHVPHGSGASSLTNSGVVLGGTGAARSAAVSMTNSFAPPQPSERKRGLNDDSVSLKRNRSLAARPGVVTLPWYYWFTGPLPANYGRRQQVAYVLNSSNIGLIWEMLQAVFSVLACGVYVVQTCTWQPWAWIGVRQSLIALVSASSLLLAYAHLFCSYAQMACVAPRCVGGRYLDVLCVLIMCCCLVVRETGHGSRLCRELRYRLSASVVCFRQSVCLPSDMSAPLVSVVVLTRLLMCGVFHGTRGPRRCKFPFTMHALVDLVTTIPVFVDVALARDQTPIFIFLRFVRILRIVRVLNIGSRRMSGQLQLQQFLPRHVDCS